MLWGAKVKITEENMMDPHAHNMHEFVICLNNTGKHLVDNRLYDFQAGQTVFLPKGISHQAIGSEKEPAEIAFICFDQQSLIKYTTPDLQNLIMELIESRHYISGFSSRGYQENLRLSEALQGELSLVKPMSQTMAGCILAQLLITHCRSLHLGSVSRGDNYAKKIADACNHIASHPGLPVSLEKMAKKVRMSRTLFSRNFKKYTGMSLIEFTLDARINTAMKHLANSRQSIIEIAFDCGFNNVGHFYRTFKKKTNMTPGQYRKYTIEVGVPLPVLKAWGT